MKQITIIAEIAQAHDGSLGIAHSFIDALAKTGIDVIKFQTHIAESESSTHEQFRVKFSYEDSSRYDYWKRIGFTREQWQEIKKHCEEAGVEFMCTPFSLAAVDFLESIGVKRYKIGSGDVTNLLMLEKVARIGKDIILSSGMNSWYELDEAVNFLGSRDVRVSLLQCTSMYPTPPERVGINVLKEMRDRYRLAVGLSDHSGRIYPSLAAAALGAEIIEVHACFDRRMFGPDSTSSLTIDEIKHLVEGLRFIEKMRIHPVDKNDLDCYANTKKIFERSLAVNKDIPAGNKLAFEDLESKKPSGIGIPSENFRSAIGKRLVKDKKKNEFLKEEDLI